MKIKSGIAYLEYLLSIVQSRYDLHLRPNDFAIEAMQLDRSELDLDSLSGVLVPHGFGTMETTDTLSFYLFSTEDQGNDYLGYAILSDTLEQAYLVGWVKNSQLVYWNDLQKGGNADGRID